LLQINLFIGGINIKTISIRGLDSSLSKKLKETAKKESKSVNQLVLDAIKECLEVKKARKFTLIHHDLDHLFGRWSEAEFIRIQDKINSERKIDQELWPWRAFS
jgi:hypothetical protein